MDRRLGNAKEVLGIVGSPLPRDDHLISNLSLESMHQVSTLE